MSLKKVFIIRESDESKSWMDMEQTPAPRPENDNRSFTTKEIRDLATVDPFFREFGYGGHNMIKSLGDEWPEIFENGMDPESEETPFVQWHTKNGVLYMVVAQHAPSHREWVQSWDPDAGDEEEYEEDEDSQIDPRGKALKFVIDDDGLIGYDFADQATSKKLQRLVARGWENMKAAVNQLPAQDKFVAPAAGVKKKDYAN